jgi:hypothetical protein
MVDATVRRSTEALRTPRGERGYRARTAVATEKVALRPRLVAIYHDSDDCSKRTGRDIPVVVLDPA